MISDYRPNTPLKWLSIEWPTVAYSPRINSYRQHNYEHSPHPQRANHIVGLEGSQICQVETDDIPNHKADQVVFPPNSYNDMKIRSFNNQWQVPYKGNAGVLINAKPLGYDTVSALKYFTGLRNFSFNEQKQFKLDPVKDTEGWEKELHEITKNTFYPIMQEKSLTAAFKPIQESTNKRSLSSSPVRNMYSAQSGRLSCCSATPAVSRRNSRCSNRSKTARSGLSSRQSLKSERSHNNAENKFNLSMEGEWNNEIEQQIFYILGGILQTQDPIIIKTWLLTATEREKNLVTNIVRSAIVDREEMNFFVKETEKDLPYRIIYTPRKQAPKLNPIKESKTSEEINKLIIDANFDIKPTKNTTSKVKSPMISTFQQTNRPESALNSDDKQWRPQTAVI